MTHAPVLDLTTSLRGDFVFSLYSHFGLEGGWFPPPPMVYGHFNIYLFIFNISLREGRAPPH